MISVFEDGTTLGLYRDPERTYAEIARFSARDAAAYREISEQARAWMWNEVGETLLSELRKHPEIKRQMGALEREVEAGRLTPAVAARRMLEIFHGR